MIIQWIQDSGGLVTAHTNEPGLTYAASYIAELRFRSPQWEVWRRGKQEPESFPTLERARQYVIKHAEEWCREDHR